MAEQLGLAESVKSTLVGTIRGAGEVANAVTDAVSARSFTPSGVPEPWALPSPGQSRMSCAAASRA